MKQMAQHIDRARMEKDQLTAALRELKITQSEKVMNLEAQTKLLKEEFLDVQTKLEEERKAAATEREAHVCR